jgi:hypothetical protein
MSEDRDATLQALFSEAHEALEPEPFTSEVMTRIERFERRRTYSRIGFDLLLVVAAWLLSEPLQGFVFDLMPGLMSALIEFDNRWLAELLLPINNLAAVLAIGFVMLRSVYRRLFS